MNVPDRFPPGQNVPSPCVGICRLDPAGATCLGCGRTLEEIAGWSRGDEAYRRAVWRRIAAAGKADDA